MKFIQTQIFKNFRKFQKKNRINIELLLIFYLIRYFNFNKILEVGFGEGCTFGAMIEATDNGDLTVVDIVFDRSLYDAIYHNTEYIKDKNIKLLTMSSLDFLDSEHTYDFINVDGDHTMPVVYDDLVKATKLIKKSGIIMVDDYMLADIDTAIDKLLTLGTDFVPFLIDEQAVYFHHISHDASDFLDIELEHILSSFCQLPNIDYKSFVVKKVGCPLAVSTHFDVFELICKHYDL